MKVLVTGGRTFSLYVLLSKTLSEFHSLNRITQLCHGGANGADSLSGTWARANRIPVQVFKADWGKYGRAAGPIRNGEMLKRFAPDIVIAFPGGAGTSNMVRQAQEANIPILKVNYND